MRHRRRTRLLRGLVLGFAVVLVAVPVAQAKPDEGSLYRGASADPLLVQGEVKDGLGASPSGAVIIGDDKRGIGTPTGGTVLVRGEVKDGLGASPSATVILADDKRGLDNQWAQRGLSPSAANWYGPVEATPQVVSSPSDGFHWGDAGIGVGTAFAVMLLGAGVLLAVRHVGRPAQV